VRKKSPTITDVTSNILRSATYCYISLTPLSCPCLTQKTEVIKQCSSRSC